MMTNLFSIFDPSTSLIKTGWLVLPISSLLFPVSIWKISQMQFKVLKLFTNVLFKEISMTTKNSKTLQFPIILLFISILIMNVIALYPNVFSITSHLSITFPLSLLFWVAIMMFGWLKNTKSLLIHLVPQGTPPPLMMFMVVIEMVSNLIRPITLCVRLTANLIAGHLLMSLLGNALLKMSITTSLLAMVIPLILTVLESAVACIQGYVFMTLITLYSMEVK